MLQPTQETESAWAVLRDLHGRLRQAGKPPEVAFVAVPRKLLSILDAIARE